MGKGIFLNGTCCLLPLFLPIMIILVVIMSMFFGGLIMLIIGIVLLISMKKKQQNVKLYKEECYGKQKENDENDENNNKNQDIKKSSISNDIEYTNELKTINVLNIITKILIILGIIFMLPLSALYVNGLITDYKNSMSYQYNLGNKYDEYDKYLPSDEEENINDYYKSIEDEENRVVVDKDSYKEKGFIKDNYIYIYYRHLDIEERSKFEYNGNYPVFYVVYKEDFDIVKDAYNEVYSIKTAKGVNYKFYLLDHDEDIYICVDKNEFENEYDSDINSLYGSIKNEYVKKGIPTRTTLRFFDEFEVNDYNIYLDISMEDVEKLGNNYTDEKLVTLPKGSIKQNRKYYISLFSIDKIYRVIYPVVICEDNRLYGFKGEKENGEVELYKIPSVLQNRIKKQIEKYKDRIKDAPKFDDGTV